MNNYFKKNFVSKTALTNKLLQKKHPLRAIEKRRENECKERGCSHMTLSPSKQVDYISNIVINFIYY
jgi:hypothetical protein